MYLMALMGLDAPVVVTFSRVLVVGDPLERYGDRPLGDQLSTGPFCQALDEPPLVGRLFYD